MRFCGEITYEQNEMGSVHSDICWRCNLDKEEATISEEYRKILHDCLDEWLDKSNGTGAFWVGDYTYFWNWCKDTEE